MPFFRVKVRIGGKTETRGFMSPSHKSAAAVTRKTLKVGDDAIGVLLSTEVLKRNKVDP